MQLTRYTDYSLRVLIYLASGNDGASIAEMADFYAISKNHLAKVVSMLADQELVSTVRGRGGGVQLACEAQDICIGELVRATENLALLECFDSESNTCPIASDCTLEVLLHQATDAFLAVLDEKSLADLMPVSRQLLQVGKKRKD